MNSTDAHGWLATLLSLPIPAYAAIASAVAGAGLAWIIEAAVPMAEWSGYRFRLTVYGIASLAGLMVGVTIWHSITALSMWVPALAAQAAREIAANRWPWLSPRAQVQLRRNAQGDVIGIKQGDDPTILVKIQPADPTPPYATPKS